MLLLVRFTPIILVPPTSMVYLHKHPFHRKRCKSIRNQAVPNTSIFKYIYIYIYHTIYKLQSLHGPCQQAVGRLYIKVTVCQFGTRLQLALASQMPATVNHGTIFPQYVLQNAKSCLGSLGLFVLLLLLTHSLDVTGCKRKSS